MADPFALINRSLNRQSANLAANGGGGFQPRTRKKLDPSNPKDRELLRRMHPDFDELMNDTQIDYRTRCQQDAGFADRFKLPPVLEPTLKLREHENSVDAICWSPDPDVFITASHDTTLKVWDARRGACTDTLRGHVAGVYHCAAASNGRLLISCGSGETKNVIMWSWPSKQICNVLHGHRRGVTHATFSGDSACAATIDQEGNLLVHDLMRGVSKCEVAPHRGVGHGSSFCREDDNLLCTVGGDGSVQLLDLREQLYPETWRLPSVSANAVTLHPPRRGIPGAHDGYAVHACEFVDRNTIFTGGADHKMKRWDLRALEKGKTKCSREYLGHSGPVRCIGVSPDQRFAVTGCEDGSLRLWPRDPLAAARASLKELRTEAKQIEARLQEEAECEGHGEVLRGLRRRRDELQVSIAPLKADEEKLKREGYIAASRMLNGHVGIVSGCAWKEDASGQRAKLLSSSWDQSVQIFDLPLGELA